MRKIIKEVLKKWFFGIAGLPTILVIKEPSFTNIVFLVISVLVLSCIGFWEELKNFYLKSIGKKRIEELEILIRNQIAVIKRIQSELEKLVKDFTQQSIDNKYNENIKKIIQELDNLKNKANNLVEGIELLDSLEDERLQTKKRDEERIKKREQQGK